MESYQKYLDPKTLSKITKLELKARLIVEGFIGGMHKSPYKGASVEFREHREYTMGDDTRHLDWKVYAKTDRYFIKEYEEETTLSTYIVLDSSESMRYSSHKVTKFDYASYIAASVAYMILNQGDTAALTVFDEGITAELPASSKLAHVRAFCHAIENSTQKKKTDVAAVLHHIAEKAPKRGVVLLISDCFAQEEDILNGLRHLAHKRHDVLVLQVLDPYELTFPFDRMTMFLGMEGYPDILCDPRPLQKAYIEEITKFNRHLRHECTKRRIDFETITTDQMLDVALTTFLATRAARDVKGG